MSGLMSTLRTSSRSLASCPRPISSSTSCSRLTAASPRNSPSSFCVASPSIMSSAVGSSSGAGRNTTSATASARMPPTPSITIAPNWASWTTPAISSRLPDTIGAINTSTSPSAGVAAPSSSVAAASTAARSPRRSLTNPRSVLWAIASPLSFATTGYPISSAASPAAAAESTNRSGAIGTPWAASRAFEARSDKVVEPAITPHRTFVEAADTGNAAFPHPPVLRWCVRNRRRASVWVTRTRERGGRSGQRSGSVTE